MGVAGSRGVAGIVLAAGAGSRFDPQGLRYKLAERLPDGRPVVRAACEAMLGAVDTLLVVCGDRVEAVRAALDGLPLAVAVCPEAGRGMGATLKHGIAATRPAVGWLVGLGDMPFVQPEAAAAVARALRAGAVMARPRHAGMAGHPVGFSSGLRAELLALDDDRGAAPLLRRLAQQVCWIEAAHDGVLRDIDVPADLPGPPGAAGT